MHHTLSVLVENSPGVLARVAGLFSRRAFNVDGVLCLPVGDGRSRIWLRVADDQRLEQTIRQLGKLHDVRAVRRHEAGHQAFLRLEAFFRDDGALPG